MGDRTAGGGRAGEGDLGDALAGGQRAAGFGAEAVDDVQHAFRQQVADQFGKHEDADGGLFGGLEHDAVAGGERRRDLPGGHQQREVPGNDLADNAERLMEVIGDGVVVDFRDRAFLRAEHASVVTEVVDRQGHVGIGRLADRLAVVEGFDQGQGGEIVFDPVGDLEQDARTVGGGRAAPGVLGLVGGVERQFDVLGGRAGDTGQDLAGDRRQIVEIFAADRGDPLAANEVVELRLDQILAGEIGYCFLIHRLSSLVARRRGALIRNDRANVAAGIGRRSRTPETLKISAACPGISFTRPKCPGARDARACVLENAVARHELASLPGTWAFQVSLRSMVRTLSRGRLRPILHFSAVDPAACGLRRPLYYHAKVMLRRTVIMLHCSKVFLRQSGQCYFGAVDEDRRRPIFRARIKIKKLEGVR